MDFKKLMQQADANQTLAEKRREHQKQRKEDKKQEEKSQQLERARKDAERLRRMKAAAERRRLEYKGLVGKQDKQHSETNPRATQSSVSDTHCRGVHSEDSKTETTNTKSQKDSSSKAVSQSLKGPPQKPSRSPTPTPTTTSSKPKPKAPVSFQDLLKLAEHKSIEVAQKEKSKIVVRDPLQMRDTSASEERVSRASSPVGKTLLDRSKRNKRTHEMMDGPASVSLNHRSSEPIGSKNGRTLQQNPRENGTSLGSDVSRPLKGKGTAGSDRGKSPLGAVLGHKPQSLADRTRNPPSQAQQKLTQKPRPLAHPVKPNSFYGAASAKLAQEGRPMFQTRRAPPKCTNRWVDELSDFVRRRQQEMEEGEDYYSDEDDYDDDDLADFVASDDEAVDGDVSSTIREIFGYDKGKFSDERFDDRTMESSYAQQMFEEQRSSHIGRMEDEEDMKMEQLELARKRRKQMGGKPGKMNLLQSKLPFGR